jgi:hypothetical protein
VNAEDLMEDLKSTLLACSSTLHVWDSSSEHFVPSGSSLGRNKMLIIVGMDEVISQRCVSFINSLVVN